MSTRQERRRQERLAKKKGKLFDKDGNELETRQWATGIGKERTYEMKIEMIQPWSVPVFKTTLPPDVLQTMIEISDQVIMLKNGEQCLQGMHAELLKLSGDYRFLWKK